MGLRMKNWGKQHVAKLLERKTSYILVDQSDEAIKIFSTEEILNKWCKKLGISIKNQEQEENEKLRLINNYYMIDHEFEEKEFSTLEELPKEASRMMGRIKDKVVFCYIVNTENKTTIYRPVEGSKGYELLPQEVQELDALIKLELVI